MGMELILGEERRRGDEERSIFCRVMGLTLFSVNGDGNPPNNGNGVYICRSEKDSRRGERRGI